MNAATIGDSLSAIVALAGLAAFCFGAIAAAISASNNMGWNNPLPRAGCGLLAAGTALLAIATWGANHVR